MDSLEGVSSLACVSLDPICTFQIWIKTSFPGVYSSNVGPLGHKITELEASRLTFLFYLEAMACFLILEV